jgi:hypothetical protein
MSREAKPSITVVIACHETARHRRYLKCTTWGVKDGVYGSLGVVHIAQEQLPDPSDKSELARVLLTALYGLDYDL